MISTIFVDFGGVLAKDGFRNGLLTIAQQHGFDPEWFQRTAVETIYHCDMWMAYVKSTYFGNYLEEIPTIRWKIIPYADFSYLDLNYGLECLNA